MNKGWVAIPRTITESWLWNDGKKFEKLKAFLDLIFCANYIDNDTLINNEVVTIKRGSFLTSALKLSKKWEWDRKTVTNFLNLLKNHGEIEYERFGNGIIITISNYSEIITAGADIFFDQKNEHPAQQQTPQPNPQSISQSIPQSGHTNKEGNKEKNEESNNVIMEEVVEEASCCPSEKHEYAKAVMLTKAEYDLLNRRYGEADTERAIEILSDYKLATGKEYLSDFYAITKWGISAVKERNTPQPNPKKDTTFELLKVNESADEFEQLMWEKLSLNCN